MDPASVLRIFRCRLVRGSLWQLWIPSRGSLNFCIHIPPPHTHARMHTYTCVSTHTRTHSTDELEEACMATGPFWPTASIEEGAFDSCGLPTKGVLISASTLPPPLGMISTVFLSWFCSSKLLQVPLKTMNCTSNKPKITYLVWTSSPSTLLQTKRWLPFCFLEDTWRKLLVKLSVVPQQPLRLGDKWRWWRKENICRG